MALVANKKVRLNYQILEALEAGLELFGFEVKALRNGQGTLEGAHVIVRGNEAYLVGMHIPPYQPQNTPKTYEPDRARRLLLKTQEIQKLSDTEKQKGLTIVPESVYNKGRYIKVSLALVRGKKKHDKRETLKRKEADRDIRRTLKRE